MPTTLRTFALTLLALTLACSNGGGAPDSGSTSGSTNGAAQCGGPPGATPLDAGFAIYDGGCFPPQGYAGNSQHVGAYCSRNGGQCVGCGSTLECAKDLDPVNGSDFCITIGCTKDSDCGEGACCTGEAGQVGSGCVPLACLGTDGGTCPAGQ